MYQFERSSTNDSALPCQTDRVVPARTLPRSRARTRVCARRASGRAASASPSGRRRRPRGPEADGVRVVDEELDRVPEGEEAPLDLLREPVTEAELLRRGSAQQYCQRIMSAPIRSNASSRSIVFPHDLCISRPVSSSTSRTSSTRPYGWRPDERDGHEAAASRTRAGSARASPRPSRPGTTSPSTRGPAGRRREISARRARRVAVRDPFRVLPAERREVDDAGVEPDVADLLDPLDRRRRTLAADAARASIHGRRSSSSCSSPETARSSSSAREPMTFRCPHSHA